MKENRSILQWNMGCINSTTEETIKGRLSLLESMLIEFAPSLIALQEAPEGATAILGSQGLESHQHEDLVSGFSRRFWTSYGSTNLIKVRDAICTHIANLRGMSRVLFWNIHLPSRMRTQDFAIRIRAHEFRNHLLAVKRNPECVESKEIIAGDFNLWPYDEGILLSQGLFASRSLVYASAKKKKYSPGSPELPLYNPTWCLFGLHSGPLGSYYSTSAADGPWYLYDQILMSPEIADTSTPHSGTHLITAVNERNLCSKSVQRPDPRIGSDHLPLITSFVVT